MLKKRFFIRKRQNENKVSSTPPDSMDNSQKTGIDSECAQSRDWYEETFKNFPPVQSVASQRSSEESIRSSNDTISILTKIADKATDTTEISSKKIRAIALVLMFISVVLSLGTYSEIVHKKICYIIPWTDEVISTIRPTTISVLCAVFLIVPAYIRSGTKLSLYTLLQNILNILFASSILSMFVGNETWDIPFINISSQALMIFCILIAWIGMKSISGFIWIFIVILAAFRITDVNTAMGFYGVVLVLCGGISFLCQAKGENQNILLALKSDFYGHRRAIQTDVRESVKTVETAASIGMKSSGLG